MKKIRTIFFVLSLFVLMTGCTADGADSDSSDSADSANLTLNVVVNNLPETGVGAMACMCNYNSFDLTKVNGSSSYITEVTGTGAERSAVFQLKVKSFATPFQVQFVPMADKSVALDKYWWQTAISGSAMYANAENCLLCDFTIYQDYSDYKSFTLTLTLTDDQKAYVGSGRIYNENYKSAFIIDAL